MPLSLRAQSGSMFQDFEYESWCFTSITTFNP